MLAELALELHAGVNIHVDGRAMKRASNEINAAQARRATIVTITARKAAGEPGAQHPKNSFNRSNFLAH